MEKALPSGRRDRGRRNRTRSRGCKDHGEPRELWGYLLSFVHHRSRPDRPAPATRDRPRSRAALLVGWGQIPDQYGRELDGDDGEVREEPRRWSGRDRSGGDRPGGCSPRPWRPRSRRTLRRIYSTGTRTGVSHQGRSEDPFRTSSMLRATVIASSGRGTAARPTSRLGRFKQGTGLPYPSRPTTGAYAAHLPITP